MRARVYIVAVVAFSVGCGNETSRSPDGASAAGNNDQAALDEVAAEAAAVAAGGPQFTWRRSLPVNDMAPGIDQIGGTELRSMIAFEGKLFAAAGYWMDTESFDSRLPGAQVFRLDSSASTWVVDHELTDVLPSGRKLFYAFASLEQVVLTRDNTGTLLPAPVRMLVAGVWARRPGLYVYTRSNAGEWRQSAFKGDYATGSQLRSFATHHDRETHHDIVFGGAQNAIFAGEYDSSANDIKWNQTPEWKGSLTATKQSQVRVLGMTEANGKLYATAAGFVLERQDGPTPTWTIVGQVHLNAQAAEGLRGVTAIANPLGDGEVLLTASDDSPARVYMVDLSKKAGTDYVIAEEQDISALLSAVVDKPVSHGVVAYNHMMIWPQATLACPSLFMGMANSSPDDPSTFGYPEHQLLRRAHFVIRDCHGNYSVRHIQDESIAPEPTLVAVRTMVLSPFADDPPGTVYAGGFDASSTPVHNSAWLYKGTPKR